MLKPIPDGMYYDSHNAVKRIAQDTLKSFLVKLGIKSADDQTMFTFPGVFTGAQAIIMLGGVKLSYASGVTYGVPGYTEIDSNRIEFDSSVSDD